MARRIVALCRALESFSAWFGKLASWLIMALVIAVCLTVVLAGLRINTLVTWGVSLPLLGDALTANRLLDLHWHLFAIVVMLGGAYALHTDGHVKVDVLSRRFSPRVRMIVTIIGDLLLLLPFCIVMSWFGWRFVVAAWASGEGSSYGGLLDRWIIKAVVPLGFVLLVLIGVARTLRHILELINPALFLPEAVKTQSEGGGT